MCYAVFHISPLKKTKTQQVANIIRKIINKNNEKKNRFGRDWPFDALKENECVLQSDVKKVFIFPVVLLLNFSVRHGYR